jgi:hypothetical protein
LSIELRGWYDELDAIESWTGDVRLRSDSWVALCANILIAFFNSFLAPQDNSIQFVKLVLRDVVVDDTESFGGLSTLGNGQPITYASFLIRLSHQRPYHVKAMYSLIFAMEKVSSFDMSINPPRS